jgi:hypothetical protein
MIDDEQGRFEETIQHDNLINNESDILESFRSETAQPSPAHVHSADPRNLQVAAASLTIAEEPKLETTAA